MPGNETLTNSTLISIHALREEGDYCFFNKFFFKVISIHALREEGDHDATAGQRPVGNFYPRPPRGGRPPKKVAEATWQNISIHALREEGDGV